MVQVSFKFGEGKSICQDESQEKIEEEQHLKIFFVISFLWWMFFWAITLSVCCLPRYPQSSVVSSPNQSCFYACKDSWGNSAPNFLGAAGPMRMLLSGQRPGVHNRCFLGLLLHNIYAPLPKTNFMVNQKSWIMGKYNLSLGWQRGGVNVWTRIKSIRSSMFQKYLSASPIASLYTLFLLLFK